MLTALINQITRTGGEKGDSPSRQ